MSEEKNNQKDWTHCACCGITLLGEKYIEDGKAYCSRNCLYSRTPQELPEVIGSDENWINGTYEHIAWDPIKITGGRRELIEVCQKHGCIPKSLMKPKSQGHGFEMRTKRF